MAKKTRLEKLDESMWQVIKSAIALSQFDHGVAAIKVDKEMCPDAAVLVCGTNVAEKMSRLQDEALFVIYGVEHVKIAAEAIAKARRGEDTL